MVVATEATEAELSPGTVVLGRYQVVGKLAQGGMAEVYLARQIGPGSFQKLVVIKRVRPHLAKDDDFVGMFVNEARLAAMINHPNVVQIFDLGNQPSQLGDGTSDWFLAMEYLDGRDMLQVGRACRQHNKAVPFDVTARIIADACAGLEHAHNLKGQDGRPLDLVHRDMSPENIIITFEGQVKVVDFGIAKARDNSIRTQAGQIKGKLGYVAPEAILGKPVDARADVFAIGATLYLFLSGRPAFTGSSPMEIFERSLKPPPRPVEVNHRVPPPLDEICMRALAQNRDERYRSAGDVRAALEGYLASTRPLGAPQLSQFMRILFPNDKDPVRQRIEKLLADAPAAPQQQKRPPTAPRTISVPQQPAVQVVVDDDRTHVVAPSGAPRAVDIPGLPPISNSGSGSGRLEDKTSTAVTVPVGRPPAAAAPARVGPSHLRSVGVSDDIPDVSNPRGRAPPSGRSDDNKTHVTGGRATLEEPGSFDVVKTVDIEAIGSRTNAAISAPPESTSARSLQRALDEVDVDISDEEDDAAASAQASLDAEISAALADDDEVERDLSAATVRTGPPTSLPPPPSSDPGLPPTVQSPFMRSAKTGARAETGDATGTELAPPAFEPSLPQPRPAEEPEQGLFQPPSHSVMAEIDAQAGVEAAPSSSSSAAAPGIALRLTMAGVGALTAFFVLLLALWQLGFLQTVIGR